jgi:hypothetical protein
VFGRSSTVNTSSGQIAGVDVIVRSWGKPVGPECRQLWSEEVLEIDRNPMPVPNPFMTQPMSIFRFARITFLVSGVIAFAATVAAQATPLDPARLVTSIYADGREGAVWAQWLDGARRGELIFALADGAMGAVRCSRAQYRRRTRRSRFRRCDEFPRVGSQEIYSQDALAGRFACERRRDAHAGQLGA